MAPANSAWQNGQFFGAVGQSNFAATVNNTFDIAYVSHEPGPLCSNPPMDCPFTQNYHDCQRHYQKSQEYSALPNATGAGVVGGISTSNPTYVLPSFVLPQRLAKVPTGAIYDFNNGAANSVYNASAGTHAAVSGIPTTTSMIGPISVSTAQTAGQLMYFNYTVDTGW
jgi:hypothetical protein